MQITDPSIRPVHTQVLQLMYNAFVTTVVTQPLCNILTTVYFFILFLQTLLYYNSYVKCIAYHLDNLSLYGAWEDVLCLGNWTRVRLLSNRYQVYSLAMIQMVFSVCFFFVVYSISNICTSDVVNHILTGGYIHYVQWTKWRGGWITQWNWPM